MANHHHSRSNHTYCSWSDVGIGSHPILKFKNALLLGCLILSLSTATCAHTFNQSKKIAQTIFNCQPITLYCGCRYDKQKRINLASCGMLTARGSKRAEAMEWEHIMPAENFGKHFACWREKLCFNKKKGKYFKGRKCCQKIDAGFRQAEGELYNLWPSVGIINGIRSNYRFAQLNQKTNIYGCNITIDVKGRKVEPQDSAKGIVARANLFMAEKYRIRLSPAQRQLFLAWSNVFPPSSWEKQWAQQVALIEGYPNPYIR